MELNFIFKNDKKRILEKLEYYGIKELPFLLIESGREKIRGYSGSLSIKEIHEIDTNPSDVHGIFKDAVGVLRGPTPPPHSQDCQFDKWLKSAIVFNI